MKRFFSAVLCLLLLAGCAAEPQTPPQTQPSVSQDQPGVPLLDQATESFGNLLSIPNTHVESMTYPEVRLYGNSLLLYEYTLEGVLQLKRISLEDGSLLAQAAYPTTPAVTVQIGNGCIGLCDSGRVQLLNDSLELDQAYDFPPEGESWYLDREMQTLYLIFPDEGLQCRDLATGQTRWLLDNAAFVQSFGSDADHILFTYTDRTDQKNYTRCLNRSTATLETLPLDGSFLFGTRSGDQWLLRRDIASGAYILSDGQNAVSFTQTEGLVQLLPGRRQLLIIDGSYREFSLYDTDGHFLSRCTLPQKEHASAGTTLVWSGYWQGYFFLDTYDSAAHLMFWDISTAQEGESLSMTPLGAVQPTVPVMDKSLYQRAQALSQRFGVDIRIAEQCALDYTHYRAEAFSDPQLVGRALDILEMALGHYPEGFFRQLLCGDISQIRIELVGKLQGQENMDTHPEAIGGFAQTGADHYLIVLEGPAMGTQTVYHELTHIIDRRLEWDANLRPQALFSEDAWLALQPQGFRYANSYTEMPDHIAAYENSGYFISRYSLTFPTEDRATLMAEIMSDKTILAENPGMAEKMAYYAACIRDCFDTTGWPESTLWEYTP